MDEKKIRIIEGPPPVFTEVREQWTSGVLDSPVLGEVALTELRTFNGPALVERCVRAWSRHEAITLEFRQPDGLIIEVPIVAARYLDTPDGDKLLLWVRLPLDDVRVEYQFADDIFDEDEDDFDDLDDDLDIDFDL